MGDMTRTIVENHIYVRAQMVDPMDAVLTCLQTSV